ncbi:sigma-54-dependent transcriptional regulator [Geoalkalibacter sp.]|uniref:sigma-54-dependent transcriptional regulator n=1 Tax=Geoalkalibacter sp. TaxID=3041440 RepID=UPI00272DFC8A|nr:sigma-54 dependent transcriptional regulator [Geoalkalibacter sp.]
MEDQSLPLFLVDDEEDILFGLRTLFRGAGFRDITTIQDSREVMGRLSQVSEAVVVLDLNMPFMDGFALLKAIRRDHPQTQVIIVTAANEVDMAVECMKEGAVDYVVKPVEKSRLLGSVRRAVDKLCLTRQVTELKRHLLDDRLNHEAAFAPIVTVNTRMRKIFHYLEAVAGTGQPVLIQGATGTGKELFARALHEASGRRGEFVAVNVAGLDDQMFSDTLFGHVRGAFTGAESPRAGLIARAADGTLFLDEIGELAEATQVRLLRLLQDGDYYPLGSDRPCRSQARIVVATNRDLKTRARARQFRQDLYYRLCGHAVDIPPLAERPEDLPLLLDHFLQEAAATMGRPAPTPPPELVNYLAAYAFPGNVRELKAMVFDAVVRHRQGILSMASFLEKMGRTPSPLLSEGEGTDLLALRLPHRIPSLKHAEDFLVAKALELSGGNQGLAATWLGLTRQGLNKKLQKKKSDESASEPL